MLRYVFVLDVAFALLGAALAIGVGVSALLLGFYLDVAPEHAGSARALVMLTIAYSAVTAAAAAGAWAIRRKAPWLWWAQGAFALALVVSFFVSRQMLTPS